MSSSLKQIEEQARELSAEERAKLAESMLESLHPPISEIESAWADEIERRVAAFDRGEIPSCAAEDVFAEARRTRLRRTMRITVNVDLMSAVNSMLTHKE